MAICRPLHESVQPALFSGPTPSFPLLESEAGTLQWGDTLSWQGTFGPRTTCPGGQLVLGPHVRGNSCSGGTRGPPTPVVYRPVQVSTLFSPTEGIFTFYHKFILDSTLVLSPLHAVYHGSA